MCMVKYLIIIKNCCSKFIFPHFLVDHFKLQEVCFFLWWIWGPRKNNNSIVYSYCLKVQNWWRKIQRIFFITDENLSNLWKTFPVEVWWTAWHKGRQESDIPLLAQQERWSRPAAVHRTSLEKSSLQVLERFKTTDMLALKEQRAEPERWKMYWREDKLYCFLHSGFIPAFRQQEDGS